MYKMRGYKIFGPDYTCRGYKYSLKSVNEYNGEIEPCKSGFHFCKRAVDCLKYYKCIPENTYAEVESGDEYIVEDDKVVCKELRIVNPLTYDQFEKLIKLENMKDTKYSRLYVALNLFIVLLSPGILIFPIINWVCWPLAYIFAIVWIVTDLKISFDFVK